MYEHGMDENCEPPKIIYDYAWIELKETDKTCPSKMKFNIDSCKCFMNYTC